MGESDQVPLPHAAEALKTVRLLQRDSPWFIPETEKSEPREERKRRLTVPGPTRTPLARRTGILWQQTETRTCDEDEDETLEAGQSDGREEVERGGEEKRKERNDSKGDLVPKFIVWHTQKCTENQKICTRLCKKHSHP